MREIGETVRKRASELLENGTVTRVFGWRKGEFDYDETPAVFRSVSEMKDFVFDGFSAANLSKFLLRGINEDGKILAVMKPCDTSVSISFLPSINSTAKRFSFSEFLVAASLTERNSEVGSKA